MKSLSHLLSFYQTWSWEYFDLRTHDKSEVCQFLPPPLCQRAEPAAVLGGRAPSCSADLTSLCLVPAWKEHCVHGKGILKMKLMQSTSQAIFIARHPFRYPIMSAAWQISPELSCFRWLSFKVLVWLMSAKNKGNTHILITSDKFLLLPSTTLLHLCKKQVPWET